MVITGVVYSAALSYAMAAFVACVAGFVWFVVPLWRRQGGPDDPGGGALEH
jgi:hypothetical protein